MEANGFSRRPLPRSTCLLGLADGWWVSPVSEDWFSGRLLPPKAAAAAAN